MSSTNTKKCQSLGCLVLILSLLPFLTYASNATERPKITVFGSSVASGAAAEKDQGYWHMMKELLESRGWEVTSCSRGGDRTNRILDRFDDLLSHNADTVFIGLSLGNEGLREKDKAGREAVFEQFRAGMLGLIQLMRDNQMTPVVGLCYPHGYYTLEEYAYVKRMNLLMNSWDVPSANFLGAIDDGTGRWVAAYEEDPWHPNTEGHREMFYTIVPSLFDAMKSGKPIPQKAGKKGSVRLGHRDGTTSILRFDSQDTLHSHALVVSVKNPIDGTIAILSGAENASSLSLSKKRFMYQSSTGAVLGSGSLETDNWHQLVISHRYAKGETLFFVDGQMIGSVPEKFAPVAFTLGAEDAGAADYQELMIYRAALNADEVQALYKGTLLQASLELYAPLQEKNLTHHMAVENRAQSLSKAVYMTGP